MGKDYRAEANSYEVVQTVSAARIQSLNGRVAPTVGPGNGENTTPKSILDLLLVLDL